MNIEEIRQTRVEAERVIFEVLRVFRETTGMVVIGCDVETASISTIDHLRPDYILTGVSLKIEPI